MSSQHSNTRSNILKAALHLLETGEGSGVRMSDIAKRAGISRQAVYLHFKSRAELLIAVTYYVDEINDTEKRLIASRTAKSGIARMDAFIDAWGNYIPDIYSIARALLAMSESDEEAASAWGKRMQDVREGCEAAVKALVEDESLSPALSEKQATDILWTLLSVRNWEQFTIQCNWSQKRYIRTLKTMARSVLLK